MNRGGPDEAPPFRPTVLRSARGLEAWVIPFGGTLVRLLAPDRAGRPGDVVLALEDVSAYAGRHPYVGSTVGRYANRIGGARFALDGREFRLAATDGPHHLHGGRVGFSHLRWKAEPFAVAGGGGLRLRHRSPDGDEGYPGALDVTATYVLDAEGALRVEYRATTDAPTVVSAPNEPRFPTARLDPGQVYAHTTVYELSVA